MASPKIRLAALYTPGEAALKPCAASIALVRQGAEPSIFREHGLLQEAERLHDVDHLERAEKAVESGRIFTLFDDGWPARWGWRMPVMHRLGEWPAGTRFGGVGSREIDEDVAEWCQSMGTEMPVLVTGGARGCDAAFAAGAPRTVLILPSGLKTVRLNPDDRITILSPFSELEAFSSRNAMIRNRLIYSSGAGTVVGAARLARGGTWRGASEALGRGERVWVRDDELDPALRGLIARGAEPIRDPKSLWSPRARPQPELALDSGGV